MGRTGLGCLIPPGDLATICFCGVPRLRLTIPVLSLAGLVLGTPPGDCGMPLVGVAGACLTGLGAGAGGGFGLGASI